MNNTMIFNNCSEFLSFVNKRYIKDVRDIYLQISTIYKDCFTLTNNHSSPNPENTENNIDNIDNIDIYNTSFFIVNFTVYPSTYPSPLKIIVNGFMNIFKSRLYKKRYEIYDVCVRKQSRNQGILTKMIEALPEKKYYYLQILFDNRIAYISYLRYFYKFISIGRLSYVNNVSFVLGGYKSKRCSDSTKNKNIKLLDSVSKRVQNIHFDEIFNDILMFKKDFLELSDPTITLNPVKINMLKNKDIVKILRDKYVHSLVVSFLNHFKE